MLADSGEDLIAFSTGSDYAANIEMAEALAPAGERAAATKALTKVATPAVHTIDEVTAFLSVAPTAIAKTLLVLADEESCGQDCAGFGHAADELIAAHPERLRAVHLVMTR